MNRFCPQKIIVLGGGSSGLAAAELAQKNGAETVLLDTSPTPKCEPLLQEMGIHCITGKKALEYNSCADMAVISPGVPKDSPLAELAGKLAPRITGELAFGASFLNVPMLAVTGTNGKTTTVEMLTHILNECGVEALAAGNIGLPLSKVAVQSPKIKAIVVEISSFQLEYAVGFRPDAAALLNITPDHLERHHTEEEYARLKISLCSMVNNNGLFVVGEQTEKKYSIRKSFPESRIVTFGADSDVRIANGTVTINGNVLTDQSHLQFSGMHNLENAAAAIILAGQMGVQPETAAEKLRSFKVGDHRLQTVFVNNGIRFIDDSKATNADAMMAALRTLKPEDGPTALIAGGLDKNCALSEVTELLSRQVSGAFLIGSCAERLKNQWGNAVRCEICTNMEDAVFKAASSIEKTGGTVLLSPACASMDMFRDYADRGDCFKAAAMKLATVKSDPAGNRAVPE